PAPLFAEGPSPRRGSGESFTLETSTHCSTAKAMPTTAATGTTTCVASSGRNAGAAIAPRGGIRGALGFLYRGESRSGIRSSARRGKEEEGEERRGDGRCGSRRFIGRRGHWRRVV